MRIPPWSKSGLLNCGDKAWLAIYARPARTEEVASARTFLERQTAEMGSKKAATAELVRVLFNTNEFLYVD